MHGVLREESAQATVEYAIVTVALLSIVLAIVGLWRAGTDGHLAALVERAASHGVASTSVIDAAAGAKDIALYWYRARGPGAVYGRGRFFAADVSDAHPSRTATGVPALYARGHGVCRRRDRAAHDHDDGGGRRS